MRTLRSVAPLLALCLWLAGAVQAEPFEPTRLELSVAGRETSALLLQPADAPALLVLAHGAQMNMRSPLLASLADSLARQGIATLRFNFPYAEAGRSEPDPPAILMATVTAALAQAEKRRGESRLLVGGQSLSTLVLVNVLASPPASVAGAVMLSFPLHAPGRPSARNARGLESVKVPLLFVSGTRDPLADLALIKGLVEKLGPRARLYQVEDADHRFLLPPESGRKREQALDGIAAAIAEFAATLGPAAGG